MKKFLLIAALLAPAVVYAEDAPAKPSAPPETQDPTIPVLLQLLHQAQDREALATVHAAQAEERVRQLQTAEKPPLPASVKLPEKKAPEAPPPPPKEPRSDEAKPGK